MARARYQRSPITSGGTPSTHGSATHQPTLMAATNVTTAVMTAIVHSGSALRTDQPSWSTSRLVLARALAVDPEVLVLVEPTSAVDAHTEARIAARLRAHRAGRTTVVTTSSPLMLDAVDEVAFLRGGRVVATGRHADLLETDPVYRAVVTRETEPAAEPVEAVG